MEILANYGTMIILVAAVFGFMMLLVSAQTTLLTPWVRQWALKR